MTETPSCLRCQTAMIAGMLADRDRSIPNQAAWVDGDRQEGWRAAFTGAAGGERPRFAVAGFRCPGCGYVELRALPPA